MGSSFLLHHLLELVSALSLQRGHWGQHSPFLVIKTSTGHAGFAQRTDSQNCGGLQTGQQRRSTLTKVLATGQVLAAGQRFTVLLQTSLGLQVGQQSPGNTIVL